MAIVERENIIEAFKELQDDICFSLEQLDGSASFQEDPWERAGGGGGRTRVIADGNVIEKGGVNFSAVHGKTPEKIAHALKLSGDEFLATGVSIVIHPSNPFVPIIHMNIRYFEINDGTWWFGGGIDLTPHYVDLGDASYFHSRLKQVCDQHDPEYYPHFKRWADDYFYIKHRNETRGIGGIFFDRINETPNHDQLQRFDFVLDVGKTFAPVYTELVNRNRNRSYEQHHKDWQYIRRGRYVEFNLVYDKGTKFGLDTDGRTESILMSLPPQANWFYNHNPQEGSPEWSTLGHLKKGIDWISEDVNH